ncbi:MAG: amino acid ABC transporter substrate-binding protein [Alphaproteobacteria bacterium]|nr:amino acid ABC transporter substrate-binding protein [Alphaproteobacteria bacterium]
MKKQLFFISFVLAIFSIAIPSAMASGDLADIKEKGVLRHLGVPYANFITGSGDGLSVEVMQLFSKRIGVKYEYVKTSWGTVINDLVGKKIKSIGEDVKILGETPIRGDVINNGLTILPWRQKVVDYSIPTFPSQVWLITRADSILKPIKPSGDINRDIKSVKAMLSGKTVLGKVGTCLDPALYHLEEVGAKTASFGGNLNDLAPAIISNAADAAILDVPDALVALEKWSGQILVLGPVSKPQMMGVGFRKSSPNLRKEFNRFLSEIWKNGTYIKLVKKYYPAVFDYYPEFFQRELN